MSVQKIMESKLAAELSPQVLEVINESHEHAGHLHGGTDTHFKVIIVSSVFEGVRSVARHQMIYKILADEMNNPVHALVMQLYTPGEWQQRQV
jgi:BolA protein